MASRTVVFPTALGPTMRFTPLRNFIDKFFKERKFLTSSDARCINVSVLFQRTLLLLAAMLRVRGL